MFLSTICAIKFPVVLCTIRIRYSFSLLWSLPSNFLLYFVPSEYGIRSACYGPCLGWLVTVGNCKNGFAESAHCSMLFVHIMSSLFLSSSDRFWMSQYCTWVKQGAVIFICAECALLLSSSAFMASLEQPFALLVAVRAAFLSSRLFWIGVGLEYG